MWEDLDPKEKILNKLFKEPGSEEKISCEIARVVPAADLNLVYSSIFGILCDLQIEGTEAKMHFDNICSHRKKMEQLLGREVGFRVGMLDYFMNTKQKLQNPKMIELEAYQKRVRLVDIDELTGLYNRRFLERYIQSEIQRSKRYGFKFSVMFLDLDDFKKINDTFGHHAGDSVLKAFAAVISRLSRTEDVVVRYGGEEFVIIIPQTDSCSAKILYQRVANGLLEYHFRYNVKVTVSAGIAEYPRHGTNAASLMEKSDEALYISKRLGKNRVSFPDERRRERRYFPNVSIWIEIAGNGSVLGMVNDVSACGISFEWPRRLQVGDVLTLGLKMPGNEGKIELRSKIIWVLVGDGEISKTKAGAMFENEGEAPLKNIVEKMTVA